MLQIVLLRPQRSNPGLTHLHPHGFPSGLTVPGIHELYENLGPITDALRAKDPDNLRNIYYTLGHHLELGQPLPTRTKFSFSHQTVLPFDIDEGVDQTRAWEYLPLVAKLLGVSPSSLIFNSSGNGLHVLAHLKTPIRSGKYLEETKANYNELIYRLNNLMKDAGLPGKGDPTAWEATRILRLPNTVNDKRGELKEAKLLQYPGFVPLDLDVVKLSGLDLFAAQNVSGSQLKKNYPRPDFQEVATQCEFLKWFVAKPDEVHEPQFASALGLLGAMAPGDKVELPGQPLLSAKELAESVFNAACNSKSLQQGDFDRKWEHGTRYGAPKCETVSKNWLGGCEKCPHHHKINTPLALKSERHLGSEVNGFWVMGPKGPLHPHYGDLTKVYSRERSYVTSEPDRIFTFGGTHYSPTGGLTIKAWLDRRMSTEDALREAHCVEFLKKILRSNVLSEEEFVSLFEQTIRGRLNCKNGIVSIITGELLPHTPSVGFKYVLPYDFEPGQVSEFFIDWLAAVMQNRTDLMDAVLDMMAYCLWPNYEDHVFAYFVGEGRNGKSTLLHVIQELVGRSNYSAVSLGQLGGNRFAPANLEGKLCNVSEESSGSDLSFEELNIIKDLSAGGEIQVERKGQQPFMLKNQAKLIFSANKTPRFHEQGKAIKSRLLVIPFDHTFENPDPNVEKKLLLEVPKICSMLVGRIQENLKANNGKFMVSRGGASAFAAQDKVLLSGNSVVEWSKESIESSVALDDSKYIVISEAYARYSQWAVANNYRPQNSSQFGYMMSHGVLPMGIASKQTKVGGKNVRIYPHTQWKEADL